MKKNMEKLMWDYVEAARALSEALWGYHDRLAGSEHAALVPHGDTRRVLRQSGVELVPQLGAVDADKMPMTAKDTAEWMEQYAKTKAGFGGEGAGKDFGKAEGVVIRTPDRRWIRKLRFEDYAKGAKRQFK